MNKLPIAALLPIYNCRERLESHLRSVVTWADEVQEIIVVDSGSSDGTFELAQDILSPYHAKFLIHPPGLYQSWNAGIAAATSPWCYISTVEDPIDSYGLIHLLETVIAHKADLVISPPEMMNHDGSSPVDQKMPSNRLAESLRKCGIQDRRLHRSEAIAMLCGFLPHGLLGSSASNLYKTSFLQKHPFPTDFRHCGDTAWGIQISPVADIAFTTRTCAKFYCQTQFTAVNPQQQLSLHKKLAELVRQSLHDRLHEAPEVAVMSGWFESYDHSLITLLDWLVREQVYQEELNSMKEKYEGGILKYLCRALQDEYMKLLRK